MTCKDCVHYNVCEEWADRTNHAYYQYGSYCEQFKDKSRFVELPCRCEDYIHSVPLDNNCELNTTMYLHCTLWRGEETKNVWHKYKKYYKDYSIVERDGFCDSAEEAEKALKERENNEVQ